MSIYEYKTVAMPSTIAARRRRRQSEADLVAETLGETISKEAVDGWEYMRAETLSAMTRGGMFSRGETETHYTVLIFRRTSEMVWREDEVPSRQAAPEPVPSAYTPPPPRTTPYAAPAAMVPAAAAAQDAPASAPAATRPVYPMDASVESVRIVPASENPQATPPVNPSSAPRSARPFPRSAQAASTGEASPAEDARVEPTLEDSTTDPRPPLGSARD